MSGRQPPWRNERFDQDRSRQLRGTLAPLDEHERDFTNLYPRRRSVEGDFDEERITIRRNRLEWQTGKRGATPTPIAAGAIANAEAGHRADISIGERAEQLAPQRPVLHAAALAIARPDDQSGPRRRRVDQGRQELGIV